MEPVTIAVGGVTYYVATKFVDQFISQEGYGWLRKMLFPKQRYVDRLYQLIEETTTEFEVEYQLSQVKFYFITLSYYLMY